MGPRANQMVANSKERDKLTDSLVTKKWYKFTIVYKISWGQIWLTYGTFGRCVIQYVMGVV